MIEYLIIFLIALVQVYIYLLMDKKLLKLNKSWILTGFIIAQLLIFPKLYFASHGFDEPKCGIPILAIHFFFMSMGGGLNTIAHVMYHFTTKKLKIQRL